MVLVHDGNSAGDGRGQCGACMEISVHGTSHTHLHTLLFFKLWVGLGGSSSITYIYFPSFLQELIRQPQGCFVNPPLTCWTPSYTTQFYRMRGQLVASSLSYSLVVDCVREINNLNNELSALDNDTLAANLCIFFINWMEGVLRRINSHNLMSTSP